MIVTRYDVPSKDCAIIRKHPHRDVWVIQHGAFLNWDPPRYLADGEFRYWPDSPAEKVAFKAASRFTLAEAKALVDTLPVRQSHGYELIIERDEGAL